jgi:hypothetical protein
MMTFLVSSATQRPLPSRSAAPSLPAGRRGENTYDPNALRYMNGNSEGYFAWLTVMKASP